AATRTFEQEIERAKARFDDIVAHEIEQRGIELEQALKIARAEALSAHVEEERRITEERRRDVAERERDASARLLATLTESEARAAKGRRPHAPPEAGATGRDRARAQRGDAADRLAARRRRASADRAASAHRVTRGGATCGSCRATVRRDVPDAARGGGEAS